MMTPVMSISCHIAGAPPILSLSQTSLVNVLSAKPPKPTPRSPLYDTVTGGRESEGPVIVISGEDEPLGVPEDVDCHSRHAEPGFRETVDSFDAYDLHFNVSRSSVVEKSMSVAVQLARGGPKPGVSSQW